jgi:uncharacterized membrane protein
LLPFTQRGGSLSDPHNFFFASLVGLKVVPMLLPLQFYFFQKVLKYFSIVSKIVLHILWLVGLCEEFSYSFVNFATLGSGSLLLAVLYLFLFIAVAYKECFIQVYSLETIDRSHEK